jgi:hypothetical protein
VARTRRGPDGGAEMAPCDQHGNLTAEKRGGGFFVCPQAALDFARLEGSGVYYRRRGALHREVRVELAPATRRARRTAARRAQLGLFEPGAGAREA